MKTICTFLTLFILPFLLFAQGEKGVVPVTSIVPSTAPSTRAVVIGISDYQNLPDLKFADRDAVAFADFLQSPAGGSVPPENIRLLTNKEATAGAVGMELWWLLQESKAGDQAIIYFSGHGDMEAQLVDQLGFLLCWDSQSFAYYSGGSIQVTTLQSIVNTLAQVNKARVLLITDACRAGKLAGSAINGTGATAANLKNFSNAAKILSCQPTEFSLEGENWGSGRGAFSYHLIDGLYGLADNDKDLQVKLKEIGRYLEDHVPAETAPHQQNPLVDGDRETLIAKVDPQMLAQWEARKKQEQPVFSPGDIRGMEHLVFEQADTGIQEVYAAYTAAVKAGNLMSPAGSSANDYYEILIHEPRIQAMHGMLTRNFVAALIDESQQVTNKILTTDPNVVSDTWSRPFVYDHIPAYLNRAIELLGEQHFLYRYLKAKQCYFEAKTYRRDRYPEIPMDSLLKRSVSKLEEGLQYDTTAAYLYLDLGITWFWRFLEFKEAMVYAKKALALSPNWAYAHVLMGRCYVEGEWNLDQGIQHYLRALELDSTCLLARQELFYVGWFFEGPPKKNYYRDRFIQEVENMRAADTASVPPYLLDWYGLALTDSNRAEEAVAVLEKIEQATKQQDFVCYQMLNCTYKALDRDTDCVRVLNKLIEINPVNKDPYFDLINIYSDQPEKIDALFEEFTQSLNSKLYDWYWILAQFGETYLELGQYEKARSLFQQILDSPCDWPQFYCINLHGRARLGLGDRIAMDQIIENSLQQWPNEPLIYYHAACLHALAKDEPKALEWLEQALKLRSAPYYWFVYDPDLDNIRNSEGFKALMQQYFPEETKE